VWRFFFLKFFPPPSFRAKVEGSFLFLEFHVMRFLYAHRRVPPPLPFLKSEIPYPPMVILLFSFLNKPTSRLPLQTASLCPSSRKRVDAPDWALLSKNLFFIIPNSLESDFAFFLIKDFFVSRFRSRRADWESPPPRSLRYSPDSLSFPSPERLPCFLPSL